jgi:hypothetical protein
MLAHPKTCLRCSSLPDVPNVYTAELVLQQLHDLHFCSCDTAVIYRHDVAHHAVSTWLFQYEEKHEKILLLNDKNSFDSCRILFHIYRRTPFTGVIRGLPHFLQKKCSFILQLPSLPETGFSA